MNIRIMNWYLAAIELTRDMVLLIKEIGLLIQHFVDIKSSHGSLFLMGEGLGAPLRSRLGGSSGLSRAQTTKTHTNNSGSLAYKSTKNRSGLRES